MQGPHGKGCFRKRPHKRKDGSQRIRWSGYLPAYNKKFYGSGEHFHEAFQNAQLKIEAYEEQLIGPRSNLDKPVEPIIPTLSEFIEQFHFKSLGKKGRRESTMRRYRDMTRHLCSFIPDKGGKPLGDRPISEVKYALLEDFIDTFVNRPRKIATDGDNYAEDVRVFLCAVYDRAFNHEFVSRNHAKCLSTIARPSKKTLEVSDEDVKALFCATEKASVQAFMLLAYEGLTISEILGLCADQIEGNQIRITRQVTRTENPNFDSSRSPHPRTNPVKVVALTHTLKRKARGRTIHLTDESMKFIMASLEKSKLVQARCDGQVITVQPVIPSRDGGIWQAHHFRETWKKLCIKAGVNMRIHDFRSLLTRDEFASGASYFELSKQLGHSDTKTTEQSYHRLASSDKPNLAVSTKRANRFMRHIANDPGALV